MLRNANKHKYFFYVLLGTTGFGAYKIISPYILTILLAVVCSALLHPIYLKIQKLTNWPSFIISSITIFGGLVILGIPMIKFGMNTVGELADIRRSGAFQSELNNLDLDPVLAKINMFTAQIPGMSSDLARQDVIEYINAAIIPVRSFFLNRLISIGLSTGSFISGLFIFIILLFTTLPVISKMRLYIEKLSPLPDKIDRLYLDRATAMIISMMKGTILIAVVQGIFAGLMLYIFGVKYTLTLTLVMIFLSIIPVVGTSIITLPIGIYFILTGNTLPGIVIILGQILVISNIDNVLRTWLVFKDAKLHPMLLLLGVFGGLNMFGFFGFIYGPVIMILFTTSLEIYLKHYR